LKFVQVDDDVERLNNDIDLSDVIVIEFVPFIPDIPSRVNIHGLSFGDCQIQKAICVVRNVLVRLNAQAERDILRPFIVDFLVKRSGNRSDFAFELIEVLLVETEENFVDFEQELLGNWKVVGEKGESDFGANPLDVKTAAGF
jgi:hypothetical protein